MPELKAISPAITFSLVLVPVAILPAVPLEAAADPTVKVVLIVLMLIIPGLSLLRLPPLLAKAEMLQVSAGHHVGLFEFVIVPVAWK